MYKRIASRTLLATNFVILLQEIVNYSLIKFNMADICKGMIRDMMSTFEISLRFRQSNIDSHISVSVNFSGY